MVAVADVADGGRVRTRFEYAVLNCCCTCSDGVVGLGRRLPTTPCIVGGGGVGKDMVLVPSANDDAATAADDNDDEDEDEDGEETTDEMTTSVVRTGRAMDVTRMY